MTDKPSPQLFVCTECGLHFEDEATAQACTDWCKKYKSCNMEITALSVERKAAF